MTLPKISLHLYTPIKVFLAVLVAVGTPIDMYMAYCFGSGNEVAGYIALIISIVLSVAYFFLYTWLLEAIPERQNQNSTKELEVKNISVSETPSIITSSCVRKDAEL